MKVFTFTSFGGCIPVVMLEEIKKQASKPLRNNPELISFVEGFDKGEYRKLQQVDLDNNTDKLLPLSAPNKGSDGITRQVFVGRAETGQACQVTINTYDEDSIRVEIQAYDGAESLVPLPEYQPVDGVPGLYARVQE